MGESKDDEWKGLDAKERGANKVIACGLQQEQASWLEMGIINSRVGTHRYICSKVME